MIFDRFRKKPQGGEDKPEQPEVPRELAAESGEFLTGDPVVDRRSLQLLLQTMAEVGSTIELEQLLVDLVDKSIEATRSERGFLLLLDESAQASSGGAASAGGSATGAGPGASAPAADDAAQSSGVIVRVARAKGGRELPLEAIYSTSVAKKVLASGEPLVNIVQSSQDALDLGQSVYDLKLRAVMCVPLAARGDLRGAIYVDSKAERQEYTQRDLAFFAALAQQLAVSLENARLYTDSLEKARLSKEFELAERIQKQLLPSQVKGLPDDLDVETWFLACDSASGDTFDIIVDSERDAVSVLLGDVSGHGLGSALIAHSGQAALRSYLEVLDDLGQVMLRLNNRFSEGIEAGSFMSMVIARVESAEGKRRLVTVNAGHGCSWLVRKGEVQTLETSGPALGMVPGFDYAASEPIELAPGDIVFLCSDGVTEARDQDRNMWGESALCEVLAREHGKGATHLITEVRKSLDAFTGATYDDDVMLLAIAVR